jgi:mannose-6-phosphate isomerase-like protein (cupin superfamily)
LIDDEIGMWAMKVDRIPAPGNRLYQEFVRSADLSVGVYRLEPGSIDAQQPHNEDELYYVLSGRARFTSGQETVNVEPGLCLFIRADEPHRFHDITERLEVLVVFGPAEGTRA